MYKNTKQDCYPEEFTTVKQEPEIYTKEEWEAQYGLPPHAFINEERE